MGWFRSAMNSEPAMMLSAVIGGAALVLPFVVVPIRRQLGYETYQWDVDPATHPYINNFGSNYKRFSFDDPKLLAAWSQHDNYSYLGELKERERDFPEARARIAARQLQ